MKIFTGVLIGVCVLFSASFAAFARSREITVIIFRHADKEAPTEGDDSDPDISIEGQRRAVRLARILEKYKPERLFSTNYARAIQTVTPLARIENLDIEFYEPGNMDALVRQILSSEDKRKIAIVGHNSTAFQLVNLLLKNDKYKMPDESDYGKIWILRIKDGKIKDRIITY